jgi:TetR/AcrR family transcriptional regulator, regulator of autoinduction and epiphytic fitness
MARRRYDMTKRGSQARETRRRIVDAAGRLFVNDGYTATSIAAIAAQAGVAIPTVYAAVGGKGDILRAVVDLQVRGDDDAAPLAARARWIAIEDEPDARRRIDRFARLHREICDREAALFAQIEAAAGGNAEATDLLAEHDQRRYTTQSRLARALERDGLLRSGVTAREAADVVWTIASERTYLALVRHRGWSPGHYERWVAEQLAAALLPQESRPARRS